MREAYGTLHLIIGALNKIQAYRAKNPSLVPGQRTGDGNKWAGYPYFDASMLRLIRALPESA